MMPDYAERCKCRISGNKNDIAAVFLKKALDLIFVFLYSHSNFNAILAQLVERVTCNLEVFGSIPKDGSALSDTGVFEYLERFPSGQRGQTVNLLAMPSKVQILLSP